jgi:hypothetical protein
MSSRSPEWPTIQGAQESPADTPVGRKVRRSRGRAVSGEVIGGGYDRHAGGAEAEFAGRGRESAQIHHADEDFHLSGAIGIQAWHSEFISQMSEQSTP